MDKRRIPKLSHLSVIEAERPNQICLKNFADGKVLGMPWLSLSFWVFTHTRQDNRTPRSTRNGPGRALETKLQETSA